MGDSEKNLADGKLSDDIIVEDVAAKTARTAKAKKTSNSRESGSNNGCVEIF